MRCLPLLLLAGCATPDSLEVGVGHSTGGANFMFDEQPGGERIDFEQEDINSAWTALTWDLNPPPRAVIPPQYPPLPEPAPKPEEEIPIDLILSVVGGALALFGAQRGAKKVAEYRAKRKKGP